MSKYWPARLEFDWQSLNNKILRISVGSSVEEGWKTTIVMGFDTKTNHAYLIAKKEEAVKC